MVQIGIIARTQIVIALYGAAEGGKGGALVAHAQFFFVGLYAHIVRKTVIQSQTHIFLHKLTYTCTYTKGSIDVTKTRARLLTGALLRRRIKHSERTNEKQNEWKKKYAKEEEKAKKN